MTATPIPALGVCVLERKVLTVENKLKGLQDAVGGLIEFVSFNTGFAAICNESGMIAQLPPVPFGKQPVVARMFSQGDVEIEAHIKEHLPYLFGDYLIVREVVGEDSLVSLSDADLTVLEASNDGRRTRKVRLAERAQSLDGRLREYEKAQS